MKLIFPSFFSSFIIRALLMLLCFEGATEAWASADSIASYELPFIELTYDSEAFNSKSFITGHFEIHEADTVRSFDCRLRHRGGTSLRFDKPNYAVKFVDSIGESLDVRFADMRKDNNWILDAMASDRSKVRNRVSADLWLAFSRPPYHQELEPKAVNGYRGQYVEVSVNGNYMGLYCLMERVDRKQLKIKKFAADEADSTQFHYRGLMYKAVNGTSTRTPYLYWQQNEPKETSASYDGMQDEYPDVTVGEPWTWNPLRDNIYFLAAKTGKTFRNGVPLRFDVPVFIDYVLFVDLLCATDNIGKNYYCWFYDLSSGDQRIGYTPWDIDWSWGRDYLGARVSAQFELKNKSNFDIRMKAQWTGYTDTLSLRYAELRDSLWSEEALVGRFDDYFDLLVQSGAWQRDQQRWTGYNCSVTDYEGEQSYIHEWIHDRLLYLDAVYGYEPPSAIEHILQDQTKPLTERNYDLFGRPASQRRGLIVTSDGKLHFLTL